MNHGFVWGVERGEVFPVECPRFQVINVIEIVREVLRERLMEFSTAFEILYPVPNTSFRR
jgi:hypothetical protein